MDERLEKLYRENLKITEEVQHIIEGKSNDNNLLDSLKILAALREASEEQASQPQVPAQRAASGKNRVTKKGGGSKVAAAPSTESTEEVAAAPSPRISLSSRLNAAKEKPSRAGSVSATRETSVKLEDGTESVASSADGVASTATGPSAANSKGSISASRGSNRLVLTKGEVVFCRHNPSAFSATKDVPEGEGILCRVTAVIGEGKQRRYEVQDADPSNPPPPPQRASVAQLIQIPESNKGLIDLPKGKHVLAEYPDTTTFYKAELSENWKAKDAGDGKGEFVKLNFQDDEQAREVERRFVLTDK